MWTIQLAKLTRDGFNLHYTDGSGRDAHAAAGTWDPTGGGSGAYLGTKSIAIDAEKLAIALTLESNTHRDNITICSDSSAALCATRNISQGAQCTSGIEIRIKRALQHLHHQGVKTYLVWVRAHIGIKGNEEADAQANLHSWKGAILRYPTTATPAGIVASSRQTRKEWRTEPGFGSSRCNYNHKAMAAYTWMRTDKGPHRSWLHHIGKADSAACPRCHTQQETGDHITFYCPALENTRSSLIGHRKEWADLDNPIRIKTGPEEKDTFDGTEEWFTFIFSILT